MKVHHPDTDKNFLACWARECASSLACACGLYCSHLHRLEKVPMKTVKMKNARASNKLIEELVRWCVSELKITTYNYNFVKNFFIGCDRDKERCGRKLKDYFSYKKAYPEYFQAGSLKDERFRSFCSLTFSLYLPALTKNGRRIFIDKVTDDEDLFDVGMIMQYFSMQTDLRYLEDGPDRGDFILFDCNHINLLNFVSFLPYFVKSLSLVLKVYPLNLELLILTNTGRPMASILNFFKNFIPVKHKKMVHFYADGADKFLLHVEADVLPSDYGGMLPSFEELRSNLIRRLDVKHEWFEKTNTQINATTFCPADEKTMTSFAQLCID